MYYILYGSSYYTYISCLRIQGLSEYDLLALIRCVAEHTEYQYQQWPWDEPCTELLLDSSR